jgi:hypothetical protein
MTDHVPPRLALHMLLNAIGVMVALLVQAVKTLLAYLRSLALAQGIR